MKEGVLTSVEPLIAGWPSMQKNIETNTNIGWSLQENNDKLFRSKTCFQPRTTPACAIQFCLRNWADLQLSAPWDSRLDVIVFAWLIGHQTAVLYLRTNQPSATSQYSLRTNQHQVSTTSQMNSLDSWRSFREQERRFPHSPNPPSIAQPKRHTCISSLTRWPPPIFHSDTATPRAPPERPHPPSHRHVGPQQRQARRALPHAAPPSAALPRVAVAGGGGAEALEARRSLGAAGGGARVGGREERRPRRRRGQRRGGREQGFVFRWGPLSWCTWCAWIAAVRLWGDVLAARMWQKRFRKKKDTSGCNFFVDPVRWQLMRWELERGISVRLTRQMCDFAQNLVTKLVVLCWLCVSV